VTPLQPPVCDNFVSGSGVSSAVIVQYEPNATVDGHFVVFDIPLAERQSTAFLATHATGDCATLVP
jgi:hypothetical protein